MIKEKDCVVRFAVSGSEERKTTREEDRGGFFKYSSY